MPTIRARFEREVVSYETLERDFTADTFEAAVALADAEAEAFNNDCPDDTLMGAEECRDWKVIGTEPLSSAA